jgi:urease accessory protein
MFDEWTVWQICDSAFPTGALAHSAGLEAAWQAGEIGSDNDLSHWTGAMLRQAAAGAIPIVSAAWAAPESVESLDQLSESFLLNHVANRASRAQGQAFLMACSKTFDSPAIQQLAATTRELRLAGHWAPVMGATCRALRLPRQRTCEMFLFLALRGAVSAAVRLGIVGPLQAQNLQHRLAAPLTPLAERFSGLPPESVAQTAPLADLLQGTQDRLYSRLFIS